MRKLLLAGALLSSILAAQDEYQWNLPKGFPKPYVPAGNPTPGSSTGALNVRYVSSFHSLARTGDANSTNAAAAAIEIEIMRFMMCLIRDPLVTPPVQMLQ